MTLFKVLELDDTPEVNQKYMQSYQELIGIFAMGNRARKGRCSVRDVPIMLVPNIPKGRTPYISFHSLRKSQSLP